MAPVFFRVATKKRKIERSLNHGTVLDRFQPLAVLRVPFFISSWSAVAS